MNNQEYLVAVQCMTYNQSQYILDALNGIVMQETSFPFVVLVVDDASTDGEQDVIRRYVYEQCETGNKEIAYEKETDYAHIAYAQHSTNRNCFIATIYLKENHYSQRKSKAAYLAEWRDHVKYIAICEGDDYWIDPQKLQRQVDFMETHPDYSLCCHKYKVYEQNTGLWHPKSYEPIHCEDTDFTFDRNDNIVTWITQPCTLLYRNDCLPDIKKYNYKYYRDVHLAYHLLENKKGYCFAFEGSVYRMCSSGIYASLDYLERRVIGCRVYSEILRNNINDQQLISELNLCNTHLLNEIRNRIYHHIPTKKITQAIVVHIKTQYQLYGFWKTLTSIRKILKSTILGILHNTKRA